MKSIHSLSLLLFLLPAAVAAENAPLSVRDLVADVSAHHPELRFYEAELAAAKAGVRIAGLRPDPELAVQAGTKRVRDAAGTLVGEGTAWSVSLAQTFEWPGRLALRKAIANREVALAELGLGRFRAALAARVQTLATNLDAAHQKSTAVREVADRFAALREVFLARDPAGITPLLETRVIEAQELALQRRATDAELAAHAAQVELNQLRGTSLETPLRLAPDSGRFQPTAATPALDQLLRAARDHHFEFRAKVLELEQQGYAVQLARHERRPSVTVSPFVSRETAGDRESIVGLGVSLPLPVTGRATHGTELVDARRRQADAAVQIAQREMEREVIAAVQTLNTKLAETRRWAPDAVGKFRAAAELADRHYRLGAVPIGTYVELQTAYLDAVEALLDTQREVLDAAARLHLLTGLNLFGNAAP